MIKELHRTASQWVLSHGGFLCLSVNPRPRTIAFHPTSAAEAVELIAAVACVGLASEALGGVWEGILAAPPNVTPVRHVTRTMSVNSRWPTPRWVDRTGRSCGDLPGLMPTPFP
jgi:hypothetical protein